MDSDKLVELVARVESKDDFLAFLQNYVSSYYDDQTSWDNKDMPGFLSGLEGFARDMEGYYRNSKIEIDFKSPSWRVFADMLLAARVYE